MSRRWLPGSRSGGRCGRSGVVTKGVCWRRKDSDGRVDAACLGMRFFPVAPAEWAGSRVRGVTMALEQACKQVDCSYFWCLGKVASADRSDVTQSLPDV